MSCDGCAFILLPGVDANRSDWQELIDIGNSQELTDTNDIQEPTNR
jgi:hypothetical protein